MIEKSGCFNYMLCLQELAVTCHKPVFTLFSLNYLNETRISFKCHLQDTRLAQSRVAAGETTLKHSGEAGRGVSPRRGLISSYRCSGGRYRCISRSHPRSNQELSLDSLSGSLCLVLPGAREPILKISMGRRCRALKPIGTDLNEINNRRAGHSGLYSGGTLCI